MVKVLLRCIEQLNDYHFKNVITIGFQSKRFLKYVDNLNQKYDINIDVFVEEKPLGECGALWIIKNKLCKDFVF